MATLVRVNLTRGSFFQKEQRNSLCLDTVPKLTPDGHTIKEIFKFGPDRTNIGTFVRTSYDLRWSFWGFGSSFASGGKIFGMSKNCRRTLRRFIFEFNSCVHFVLRKAIVRASCQIVSSSSSLRVIIGAIGLFSPREDNSKEARNCTIVLGRQHDHVKPSQRPRMAS